MTLGAFLRRLRKRDGKKIEDLASAVGMHLATAYKCETNGPVRWKTVKLLYSALCRNDKEKAELIARWAISNDPSFVSNSEDVAAAIIKIAKEARDKKIPAEALAVAVLMRNTPTTDRTLFKRFSEHFFANPFTRKMAQLWLDAFESK